MLRLKMHKRAWRSAVRNTEAFPAGRIMLRIMALRTVRDTLPMAATSPGPAIVFHGKPALKIVCHAAQSFFRKHARERSVIFDNLLGSRTQPCFAAV
jgi:hypothetical protein